MLTAPDCPPAAVALALATGVSAGSLANNLWDNATAPEKINALMDNDQSMVASWLHQLDSRYKYTPSRL